MDDATARRLFDANAETYDRVNTVISLGLDARWRSWAARHAVTRVGAHVLDAFAGTGQVGLRAAKLGAKVTLADVSPGMLAVAHRRAARDGIAIKAVTADLTADPLRLDEGVFDAIVVMWGVRYLDDPSGVLRRLSGQLVPGGRVVIVEFVEPTRALISRLAGAYFSRVLPRIAGALAGRRELYRELVATTHALGNEERLLGIVREAGLEIVEKHEMGFGLVVGVVAIAAD